MLAVAGSRTIQAVMSPLERLTLLIEGADTDAYPASLWLADVLGRVASHPAQRLGNLSW